MRHATPPGPGAVDCETFTLPWGRLHALLVVDEIGYLPGRRSGQCCSEPISARHEHASTVLTSNKGFKEWGRVVGDEVMAAALIDGLLHHCQIVNIRGNSYRMQAYPDLLRPRSDDEVRNSAA